MDNFNHYHKHKYTYVHTCKHIIFPRIAFANTTIHYEIQYSELSNGLCGPQGTKDAITDVASVSQTMHRRHVVAGYRYKHV